MIFLKSLKERSKEIAKNAGASLIDLGDGVLCCEFHAKMNAIGDDILAMLQAGVKRLSTDFDAMVVANQGVHFSAGANLLAASGERAGAGVGRLARRHTQIPERDDGAEACAASRGRRAAGNGAGGRLRSLPARRAHPRNGRSLYRSGGDRRGPDPGGRRLEGDAGSRQ